MDSFTRRNLPGYLEYKSVFSQNVKTISLIHLTEICRINIQMITFVPYPKGKK